MASTLQNALQSKTVREGERYFLRIRHVLARTGKSRSALYADIQAGSFPAPIRLGERAVAWDSYAVDDWMEARVAMSRSGS